LYDLSLEIWMVVNEGVSENGALIYSQDKGWSDSKGSWTTLECLNSSSEEPSLDLVSNLLRSHIETKVSSISSDIGDEATFL